MIAKLKAELQTRPFLSKIVYSFGFLTSERIIRILVGLFVHAQMARYLGPDAFGKMNYIVRWVTIFTTIPLYAMDDSIVRDLLKTDDKKNINSIIMNVSVLRVLLSVGSFLLLGASLLILQPQNTKFMGLTMFYGLAILTTPFFTFELTYLKDLQIKSLFHARIFSFGASSVLKYLGCVTGLSIIYFLTVYLLENLLVSILVLKNYIANYYSSEWKIDKAYLKNLLRLCTPLFAASFTLLVDQRVSLIFIEKYCSLTDLGNYTVAQTLVDLLAFIPLAVTTSIYPSLIKVHESNPDLYRHRLQQYMDIMVWTSIAFIVGTFIVAPYVITILYGPKYPGADKLLQIAILMTLFSHVNLVRLRWFTIEKRIYSWLTLSIFSLVVSLTLQYFITPTYGVTGSLWAYLAGGVLSNVLISIFNEDVRKSLQMFAKSFLFPIRIYKRIRN